MRIAYLDCSSGIAGDMMLGACIDAGVSPETIEKPLQDLLPGLRISVEEVRKAGLRATNVTVHAERSSILRTAMNIRSLMEQAEVSGRASLLALKIFDRLAEAEAMVHGTDVAHLVLHELGSPDTIVDILGAAIALDALNIDQVQSSSIATGMGMIKTQHGVFPIPGPAVTELLKGAPIFSRGVPYELVTPTGAAIVAATAASFGDPPAMRLLAAGYGAGDRELEHPNVLRILLGDSIEESTSPASAAGIESIVVIETTIDDIDGELIGYVCEEARRLGAHDAYAIAATMKKGRPGAVLTVLAPPELEQILRDLIFTQTTTLGIRRRVEQRHVLGRETQIVEVEGHEIHIKIARNEDGYILHASPEHDDCAAAARALGVSLVEIRERAKAELT